MNIETPYYHHIWAHGFALTTLLQLNKLHISSGMTNLTGGTVGPKTTAPRIQSGNSKH
jgi:hypothetical protein